MRATEHSTVVGVFGDYEPAQRAIDDLHRAGFGDDQIGFIMRGGGESLEMEEHAPDPGGAAIGGMVAGAGVGGVIAAAAAMLIPGFGPVIAGGILATVVSGAALGAAAGGILGALVGMGVPEEEAAYYEREFNEGRLLVTVRAGDRFDDARDVLRHAGAYDVGDRTEIDEGAPLTNLPTTERTSLGTPTAPPMGTSSSPTTGFTVPTSVEHGDAQRRLQMGVTGVQTWQEYSPRYQRSWEADYGASGGRWEESEPYYRFGHEMGTDPRYADREWVDVEPELRAEYPRWARRVGYEHEANENSWERFKDYVRLSWDDRRNERRAA